MTPTAENRRDALAEQLFGSAIGALEILHVYVGRKLGLYEVPGVAEVVCDPDSLALVSPLAPMVVGISQAMPAVLEAFRTGAGVPYEDYGTDIREGIADINRPGFVNSLASDWIPAMPDIASRLGQPGARAADLGCGTGISTMALARGFPAAGVDGLDLDSASIDAATKAAAEAALGGRVTFACRDAADPELAGRYDLVTLFETLHDMAHPVAETFTAPVDELDRFNYGWSAVHCLAAAMTEPDSAATGTVIRETTVRDYATQAGFSKCTVLPIEHDFWRFYRLDP